MGCFCKRTRTLHCKVVLLDEQELVQEIQENSPGHEVLDTVFRHLNLLETAYFGLRYLDTANQPHWLDPTKKVARELKGTVSCTLYFGVKFYAADPCKLLEEITRYQFYLQVKQDILQGRLPVNFDLASELGAYVVQSELGDYDSRRHSPGYVSEFRFVSNQSAELENRIAELHKSLVGKLPADAELAYLDRVKWLDMYGVDLHPVLGEDNVEYFLGLTPSGIIVLRNKNKVGNYYWPRITKIYFKGRYFMLRVCDKNSEESTYGFETPSRAACKQLWKCCVEHHAFFRLVCVSPPPNDIFRLSSRFRYSGRTEKQARSDVEAGRRAPPAFERSPSRRQQRRVVEGSAGGPGPTPAPAPAPSKWQGRRVVEGAPHTPSVEEIENRENVPPSDKDKVTSNVGRQPGPPSPPLSTRSTRSAPWAEPHARGLYSGSPRSARSACSTGTARAASANQRHRRSSSVESHSSNDSRPCRRHRRHRSRKGSDSESEVSKCSERCHSRCRHRHRRHRSRHKSSNSGSRVELVDSTGQWREVQRRQADGAGVSAAGRGSRVQQAVVVSSRRSGYAPDAEAGAREPQHGRHKRRVRSKHRSRSQSPSESKRLPDELKQHLDFDLVDTEGMSEAQLREIPYTVIQTNAKAVKVKMSPSNRRRAHRTSRRSLKSLEDGGSTDRLSVNSQPASLASRSALRVPPLPGSPSASSLLERPDRPASARGSGSASLASASQSAVPGPLPRPSGAQLNGSANLPPQHGGPDGLHEAHLPKYIKSLKTLQPSQYGSRSQAAPSFSSSDRLDASDGLGVTSFMSSGANANRARGASSPHGYRPGVWCEVKPSGGYAASAALSAPSLAASVNGGLQHSLRGGGGGRRAGGSPSSPLPPVVTPYGVTFPHLSGQHGLHGQPRGRAAQPSLGQQAGQVGRAGPLFFQQQRQQQQQHQHQQTHTPVVGNALYNDCASVKALKTSERVQNAAYISLQCSDPLLNGNGPVHQKQCSTESCTEL